MKYLLAVLFLLAIPQAADAVWFDASWDYRVKVTIDSTQVDGSAAHTNFPAYIDLADLPADFHTNVKTDGCDIRVVESDETTETAFELVSYDDTADSGELHALVDSLSHNTDTDLYIYYGNSSASCYAVTDTYGRNAVWSDYEFVSHDGGSTDSAGNYTPTARGGVTGGNSIGQIGDATDYDGTDDSFNYGNISITGSFSVQGWVTLDQTRNQYIFSKYIGGGSTRSLILRYDNSNWEFDVIQTGGSFAVAEWANSPGSDFRFVHGVFDSPNTDSFLYVDGIERATANPSNVQNTNTDFIVGDDGDVGDAPWDGDIDGARLRLSPLSADWITTEYNNQSSASTFYTVGSQETDTGGGGGSTRRIIIIQ